MGAGYRYWHNGRAPRRTCPVCGKEVTLVCIAQASNGEELWGLPSEHKHEGPPITMLADGHGGIDEMFDGFQKQSSKGA